MTFASALYEGAVTHARFAPVAHAFRYRVFALLLDLDELPALAKRSWLFAHNRAGLLSFRDRDHGDGGDPRAWIAGKLAAAGIEAGGPLRVLCYPRLFGYVFNPLSVWFCHAKDGTLAATVYEVHNTFGERHAYVLRADGNAPSVRQECAKGFYVSPFLSLDCAYAFHVRPPGDTVSIAIRESEAGRPVLNAAFTGVRVPFCNRTLASAFLRHPLMTLKIVGAIHFEALRLWLKRVPHHVHDRAILNAGP